MYAARNGVNPVAAPERHWTSGGSVSIILNDSYVPAVGGRRMQVGVADGGFWTVYGYDPADESRCLTVTRPGGDDGRMYYADVATSMHGYGVLVTSRDNLIRTTDSNNLLRVGGLNFGVASLYPGSLVSAAVLNQEVWAFSSRGAEVWSDVGTYPFPLARQMTSIEEGCIAPYSVANVGGRLIWLGQSTRGSVVAFASEGYRASRISTHAQEYEWQTYSTLSDAVGYAYQQGGHTFYVLNFLAAGKTWCYDTTTGLWHERAAFSNGEWARHPVGFHAAVGPENLVGSVESGTIYTYDLNSYTDDVRPRHWVRRWRALTEVATEPMTYSSLRVDMETGMTAMADDTPTMLLRWSDDGGHTWSGYRRASAGKVGETRAYVQFNRLGSTRRHTGLDRIFELSGDANMRVAIVGAQLDVG